MSLDVTFYMPVNKSLSKKEVRNLWAKTYQETRH